MKDISLRLVLIFAAVIMSLITAVFLYKTKTPELVLYDGKSGEVYFKTAATDGLEFSVEFIHSVNKSPVTDVFVIKNERIFAERTVYSAFGAGVQTELSGGESLSYDEDGNMVVSGFNTEFEQVKYIVGTVSDHVLTVNSQAYSLSGLCGRNSHVIFEIR